MPVSKISVVNLRMPSAQASTSEIALVIKVPVPACSSSTLSFRTRLAYSTCFMLRLMLLANLRTYSRLMNRDPCTTAMAIK